MSATNGASGVPGDLDFVMNTTTVGEVGTSYEELAARFGTIIENHNASTADLYTKGFVGYISDHLKGIFKTIEDDQNKYVKKVKAFSEAVTDIVGTTKKYVQDIGDSLQLKGKE